MIQWFIDIWHASWKNKVQLIFSALLMITIIAMLIYAIGWLECGKSIDNSSDLVKDAVKDALNNPF
jgi:hypothetical protein